MSKSEFGDIERSDRMRTNVATIEATTIFARRVSMGDEDTRIQLRCENEKTRSLSGSGRGVGGTGCVSASPEGALLIRGGPGSIGDLPVAIEPLLEAPLGNDVDARAREHLVTRELFREARDRDRSVIEREEEPVDQAQGKDLLDSPSQGETLDTENNLAAESVAMLLSRNCNRRYLGKRWRVFLECRACHDLRAFNRDNIVVDVERDLLDG